MNSTVRVYVNEKRIATGKPWKNQFLQVFPEKKTFASEAEWRSRIYEGLMPSIKFVAESEKEKEKEKETAKEEKPVVDHNWICGYCRLAPGNDHRMCICHGYNYSVEAWKNGRVYPNKGKVQTTTLSRGADDWTYQKATRMTFPPGTYYIGDLCYALDEFLYDNVFGPRYKDGCYMSNLNTADIFMVGGTGGDGEFKGTDGKLYCVDAGIIGIASESTLGMKKKPYDGGSMYTFKGNVSVHFREDKFRFFSDNSEDPDLTIYIEEDEEEEDYDDSE